MESIEKNNLLLDVVGKVLQFCQDQSQRSHSQNIKLKFFSDITRFSSSDDINRGELIQK